MFFAHKGILHKMFGLFVHTIDETLSHFHPYSIVTGDGWIRGLKCVKGMKELDKMFYFILHNSRLTYRTWPCSKLVV